MIIVPLRVDAEYFFVVPAPYLRLIYALYALDMHLIYALNILADVVRIGEAGEVTLDDSGVEDIQLG